LDIPEVRDMLWNMNSIKKIMVGIAACAVFVWGASAAHAKDANTETRNAELGAKRSANLAERRSKIAGKKARLISKTAAKREKKAKKAELKAKKEAEKEAKHRINTPKEDSAEPAGETGRSS
jgi:hypothetical protein